MDAVAIVFHVNGFVVQRLLAAIEVLDELCNATVVFEFGVFGLARLRIGGAFVGQRDQQSLVEECEFAQALRQRVVVILGRGEDRAIGEEVNLRPSLLGRTRLLQLVGRVALGIVLLPRRPISPDFEIEVFAQRIHARHTHAVQTARNFIGGRIKFSAGMQSRHHDLRRGNLLAIDHHVIDRNATTVIDHGNGIVEMDRNFDLGGESGKRFVDGVVDHFIHQVMQAEVTGRSDVHRGTLAHRFHPAQHFNGVGIVVVVAAVAPGVRGGDRSYCSVF